MTEAQALGLLFVVVSFVAYGVWDLSHHRSEKRDERI
jgi:hypothetical protein